jgi:site-specific DNA recombinase
VNKYFLYTRKSSDSEDRQILSIEAQIQELRDFARQNSLIIVNEFTESMSAKKPGRPVFNRMLTELEQGLADGIIAWHPDRLARNIYDGGKIQYFIDQGIIQDLKFPTFHFDKSANGIFNLSIAFSQAQYFVQGLRENVNRGIRQKLRRGEYPGKAPYGYINHYKTRTIEPDPEHFETVQKLFIKFANSDINQKQMIDIMFESGIKNRVGKPLVFGTVSHMLKNPFYYGVFKIKGELYQGTHKPMIDKETYERIQKRLELNPRNKSKRKEEIEFLFPQLAECGECGYSVTFEHHKKSNNIFKYYRCTHKSKTSRCSQRKYLREEELSKQVKQFISQVAIDDEIYEKLKNKSYEWDSEDTGNSKVVLQSFKSELENNKNKLNNLLDLQLEGEITLEEYKSMKNNLIEKKADLQAEIKKIQSKASKRLELELTFLQSCNQAYHSLKNQNYQQMNKLLQKIGSNRKITNQKLEIQFFRPFNFLSEFSVETGYSSSHDELNVRNDSKQERNSKASLAKQDSFAVCERRRREQARQPKAAEHPERELAVISDCEWYRWSGLNRHSLMGTRF